MSVLFLQIFVSLCLVAGSIVLYVFTVRESTFEHSDRLALAPLDDDERRADCASPGASPGEAPAAAREATAPPSATKRVVETCSGTGSEPIRPRERP